MTRLILRKTFLAIITILAIIVLTGFLLHLVPGDPVTALAALGASSNPQVMAEMRSRLGLDLPVWQQVGLYVWNVLHADLGKTIRGDEPVLNVLLSRLPSTLILAVSGLGMALLVGIPVGVFSAVKRGSVADAVLTMIMVFGASLPAFWTGLLLVQVFSLKLGWLPVAGTGWRNLLLPALTLGLAYCTLVSRVTRSAIVEVLGKDYVRTARARGLREHQVLLVHALRPALLSIATVGGLIFAHLLGGQIVVENVFAWNGIGRVAVQAMLARDYPLIQGFIIVFSTSIVILSTVLDVLYAALDPRIRRI
ncbi:ABC transporter permease (plasmid) [Sinorhizobium sp. B11]